jgi:hypothetical protein
MKLTWVMLKKIKIPDVAQPRHVTKYVKGDD